MSTPSRMLRPRPPTGNAPASSRKNLRRRVIWHRTQGSTTRGLKSWSFSLHGPRTDPGSRSPDLPQLHQRQPRYRNATIAANPSPVRPATRTLAHRLPANPAWGPPLWRTAYRLWHRSTEGHLPRPLRSRSGTSAAWRIPPGCHRHVGGLVAVAHELRGPVLPGRPRMQRRPFRRDHVRRQVRPLLPGRPRWQPPRYRAPGCAAS